MSSNRAGKPPTARVTVENVNHPGFTTSVEKPKYDAVKRAMLKALPRAAPGLTQEEMVDAVMACLPPDLFPGGAKAGWWTKTVQLDLEAKGLIVRGTSSPLHWRRAR
jgi:hypothetical protein